MGTPTADEPDRQDATATYRHALDARLTEANEHGDASWEDLLRAAQGADPRIVAQSIQRLGWEVRGMALGQTPSQADEWTPELHALDFEWYFDKASAQALAQRVGGPKRHVLCLGAPTVATAVLQDPLVERVTLVDRNPLAHARSGTPRPERMHALVEDLESVRLAAGRYDGAVLDAPWYPEALDHWLRVAAHAVRPGGTIIFALLGPLHRPGAAADRTTIVAHARKLGPTVVRPGALRYESPRFEREAFASAGVRTPRHWRHADWVEVTRTNSVGVVPVSPLRPSPWTRYVVGSQVVQLCSTAPNEPGPLLQSIDGREDFRYGSISTRDPLRARIGLWTSRSRVAQVRRPTQLAELLEQWSQTGDIEALRQHPALQGLNPRAQQQTLAALRTVLDGVCPSVPMR